VNCAPPLPVHNKFSCLGIESESPHFPTQKTEKPIPVAPASLLTCSLHHIPKWEHKLPKKYVVVASPSPKSLMIKVEIQTTDTVEVRSSPTLIDSGTTGLFMDQRYVECYKLTTRKLQLPIPVYNVDGSPNEAGAITKAVKVILRLNGHAEQVNFAVTNLSKQNLILGFTWLQEHNPKINWQMGKITMSHCPDRCHTC
jgi:Retroviral aspartyl protease